MENYVFIGVLTAIVAYLLFQNYRLTEIIASGNWQAIARRDLMKTHIKKGGSQGVSDPGQIEQAFHDGNAKTDAEAVEVDHPPEMPPRS